MDHTLQKALDHLAAVQDASGRFPSRAHGDVTLGGTGYDDRTPFVTAFLCPTLDLVGTPRALELRQRATSFLIDRAEPPGVWRYWRDDDHVLDPDLDDTACASFALRDRHLSMLCGANRRLLLAQRDDRGRFQTWMRPVDRANDVDSVVNANVLAYLGEGPETADAIAWLDRLVAEDRVTGSSWYYVLEEASLVYAMARAVQAGVGGLRDAAVGLCERLVARLEARPPEGALETAMGLASLLGLGVDGRDDFVRRAVEALATRQRDDGSWPAEAFYCGPEPPGPRSVYFGSTALTTGLCLEALVRASGSAPCGARKGDMPAAGTQAC